MIERTTLEPGFKYDGSQRPLLAVARSGVIALAVITVPSLLVWGGKNDMPGVWGVFLGMGISGSLVLFIALGILFTVRASPFVALAVVLGGWLLKTVVLIGVLVVIGSLEFHNNMTFFVTVVLMLMTTLSVKVWGMSQSNLTRVQPMKDEQLVSDLLTC